MRKSSPEELRKLRARAKQEEKKMLEEDGMEKRLGTHETSKQRKFVVAVTWVIAIAFIITSVGFLIIFGMGTVQKKDDESRGVPERTVSQEERERQLHDENIKRFSEMIVKEPDNSQNYNNLAAEYAQIGKYDDAITTYKKAMEIDPKDTFSLRGLADIYIVQEKYGDAKETLVKAVGMEEKANQPPIYEKLAAVEYQNKNKEGAIEYLKKAVEIDPGAIKYYLSLAQIYDEKGDKTEALKMIESGTEVATAMNDTQNIAILEFMKNKISSPPKSPAPGAGKLPDVNVPGRNDRENVPSFPGDKKPGEETEQPKAGETGVKPGESKAKPVEETKAEPVVTPAVQEQPAPAATGAVENKPAAPAPAPAAPAGKTGNKTEEDIPMPE